MNCLDPELFDTHLNCGEIKQREPFFFMFIIHLLLVLSLAGSIIMEDFQTKAGALSRLRQETRAGGQWT